MKKIANLFLLYLSLIVISACGQKEETSLSSEMKQTSQTTSSTTFTTEVQESMTVESTDSTQDTTVEATTTTPQTKDAQFNGSYYSVQGKYGEVIIANKKHPLSSSYAPGEDPTALAAFWQLHAAMQSSGFALSNQYSGFRSYETQQGLYNDYVARDGQANADRYSARPGFSEHQTGLAFDLMDANGQLLQEPAAVRWLSQHAHEYGFVVRYLAEKEAITGYMPETWHIRYIGQEATDIYRSGLTLEEYYGVAGGDYE